MRQLYKAKRVDTKEWVEGNLILSNDADEEYKAIIIPVANSNMFTRDDCDLGFENWYIVDPTTICQYVGLPDKNGQKIWENDVVRIVYNGIEYIYKVIWDISELDFKATNGNENYKSNFQYLPCCEEIEVIGNIFDNPDYIQ